MSMMFWDYPQLPVQFMNREHETFVGLMNDAEQALTMGTFSVQHFRRLVQHCQEHFAHEEREMQRTHFPGFELHKKQHDRVVLEMTELLKGYVATQDIEPLLSYLQDVLPEWFTQHIHTQDQVTAQYLAAAYAKSNRRVKSIG
ncbi:bacteriohemerythrin [Thalassolituus sp.]|uniref:bacteriohemerythrin n=1 Tax=Thalassolituus sp. TaxID=2030822 RepID=UPI00243B520D|nr:hemerythrin family protein [Thalassolituus sp.]